MKKNSLITQTLSLALRPKCFSQLLGQKDIVDAIQSQMASKREPRAWMFAGPTGTGKTTIARIIAKSLQCRHSDTFGEPCAKCQKNKEFDISEMNIAELNGIDAIKEIASHSTFFPTPGSRRKVIILDEAQRVTKAAQSVLLKYFEDASKSTTWIICTTEPEQILKALRGRCYQLQVRPIRGAIAEAFIKEAAAKAGITRKLNDFIEQVHIYGVSGPRDILNALEKFASGIDPEEAVRVSTSGLDVLRICQNLRQGNWAIIKTELRNAQPEDAMLLKTSLLSYLRNLLLHPTPGAELKTLALAIDTIGSIPFSNDDTVLALLTSKIYQLSKRF